MNLLTIRMLTLIIAFELIDGSRCLGLLCFYIVEGIVETSLYHHRLHHVLARYWRYLLLLLVKVYDFCLCLEDVGHWSIINIFRDTMHGDNLLDDFLELSLFLGVLIKFVDLE